MLQAEDRIHRYQLRFTQKISSNNFQFDRIGQLSKEVKLIYILARNTADDVVWEQIQKKYSVLGATIGKMQFDDIVMRVFLKLDIRKCGWNSPFFTCNSHFNQKRTRASG